MLRASLTVILICLSCMSCGRREVPEHASAVVPAEPSCYEFLSGVLGSLARAGNGIAIVREASTQTSLVDLMTANQNGAVEIRMAASELQPYSASRNADRHDAVESMLGAYEMIGQSLAIQLAAYERMDSAQTVQDIAALAGLRKKASDAKVAYQQGASILVTATTLALGSVMVADHGDTNHVALDMTDKEREQLVATADSLFGGAPSSNDDSGPVAAAKILRTALDKPWRVAR